MQIGVGAFHSQSRNFVRITKTAAGLPSAGLTAVIWQGFYPFSKPKQEDQNINKSVDQFLPYNTEECLMETELLILLGRNWRQKIWNEDNWNRENEFKARDYRETCSRKSMLFRHTRSFKCDERYVSRKESLVFHLIRESNQLRVICKAGLACK